MIVRCTQSTSLGRMIKWTMMLTQFAIEYKPMTTIKRHAIMECIARNPKPNKPSQFEELWWEFDTNGAS